MNKVEIVANGNVALNQARSLVDKLKGDNQHQARILFYSLESMVEKLEAEPDLEQLVIEQKKTMAELEASFNAQREAFDAEQANGRALTTQLAAATADVERLAAFEAKCAELADELEQAQNKVAGMQGDISHLNQKLATAEKEAKDKIKKAQEHAQSEIDKAKSKSQDAIKKEARKLKPLQSENAELKKECAQLAKDLSRMNGTKVSKDRYKGKSPGVEFFIHEFSSPLHIRILEKTGTKPLPDCNWHYQVMRSNGVAVNIGATEWLSPVIPESEEFQREWNPAISERLHELMLEQAKTSHPHHYKLALAAKKEYISNHAIFDDYEKALLKKAKLLSLYDSVSLTHHGFTTKVRAVDKNIDEESILVLRAKITGLAHKFVKTQGAEGEKKAA